MIKSTIKSIVGILTILMVVPIVSMAGAVAIAEPDNPSIYVVYPTYTEITDDMTCVYTIHPVVIVGSCLYNIPIVSETPIGQINTNSEPAAEDSISDTEYVTNSNVDDSVPVDSVYGISEDSAP